MTPEEVAAAARDPRRGATDAEFFIRTGRFDEAAAAFDREHSDNKVIAYFETAEALTVQWNKFSHLATLTTLGNTDFSADLKKIVSLYEKRKRLEAELVQQYRDAPFAP